MRKYDREFAFYCPDLDCIVIQVIMEEYRIAFEFDWCYAAKAHQETKKYNVDDPLELYSLLPLGEV